MIGFMKSSKVVLDTSTLLYDPKAFTAFPGCDVYIPACVLEEIDGFKKDIGGKGKNARQFHRDMDKLRQKKEASFTKGIPLSNKSLLIVCLPLIPEKGHFSRLDLTLADNRILATTLSLKKEYPDHPVELITKDINLRIKANVHGVHSRDYTPPSEDPDTSYTGLKTWKIDKAYMENFIKNRKLPLSDEDLSQSSFYANQYVIIVSEESKVSVRYDKKAKALIPVLEQTEAIWGVHPRNLEQQFALDALLNDSIKLVTLLGKAGTGKTLLALAGGLYKTLEKSVFRKLLISRPVFPIGKDIGYLPGDIEQKLNPWMQPIFDNIEQLIGVNKEHPKSIRNLINQNLIHIEPLPYMRGRSISNQFLIVDEAQNLSPHEIKTILTRAGQNTKVVLTGDLGQIDNPYVDTIHNGLTYCVNRFKDKEVAAHISFQKGERSPLAELASNIL